jgi:hypothetical protein
MAVYHAYTKTSRPTNGDPSVHLFHLRLTELSDIFGKRDLPLGYIFEDPSEFRAQAEILIAQRHLLSESLPGYEKRRGDDHTPIKMGSRWGYSWVPATYECKPVDLQAMCAQAPFRRAKN